MRKTCKCCGAPLNLAFQEWNQMQMEEVEKLMEIWGEATVIRALYVSPPLLAGGGNGFADPAWEREWLYVRSGRAGYPDDDPRHRKMGIKGRAQLERLVLHILEMD